jgi:hypothetical protein
METDLVTIIIVVLASSTFLVPIVYFEYFRKRAAVKFAAGFKKASHKNSLHLSQYDVWNDRYGIGIDPAAKKMIYLNQANGQAVTLVQDLRELKKCRVEREDSLLAMPDGNRKIPARVNLQLEFTSPGKNQVSVEFYKAKIGDSLRDEVLLAEKWAKIINANIRKH